MSVILPNILNLSEFPKISMIWKSIPSQLDKKEQEVHL